MDAARRQRESLVSCPNGVILKCSDLPELPPNIYIQESDAAVGRTLCPVGPLVKTGDQNNIYNMVVLNVINYFLLLLHSCDNSRHKLKIAGSGAPVGQKVEHGIVDEHAMVLRIAYEDRLAFGHILLNEPDGRLLVRIDVEVTSPR